MNQSFTSEHHAVIFALLAKNIIAATGIETGKGIIGRAIRKYGNQRGRRMALRAQRNGDALTLWNYLAYQEWAAGKNELKKRIRFDRDYMHAQFTKCPWVEHWKKHGLLEFGKLFCPATDYALFETFNPGIGMKLLKNRANGDDCCDFHFENVKFSIVQAARMGIKKIRLKSSAVKTWDYHAGHIYKTVKETVTEERPGEADAIVSGSLAEFEKIFGHPALQALVKHEHTDFDVV